MRNGVNAEFIVLSILLLSAFGIYECFCDDCYDKVFMISDVSISLTCNQSSLTLQWSITNLYSHTLQTDGVEYINTLAYKCYYNNSEVASGELVDQERTYFNPPLVKEFSLSLPLPAGAVCTTTGCYTHRAGSHDTKFKLDTANCTASSTAVARTVTSKLSSPLTSSTTGGVPMAATASQKMIIAPSSTVMTDSINVPGNHPSILPQPFKPVDNGKWLDGPLLVIAGLISLAGLLLIAMGVVTLTVSRRYAKLKNTRLSAEKKYFHNLKYFDQFEPVVPSASTHSAPSAPSLCTPLHYPADSNCVDDESNIQVPITERDNETTNVYCEIPCTWTPVSTDDGIPHLSLLSLEFSSHSEESIPDCHMTSKSGVTCQGYMTNSMVYCS